MWLPATHVDGGGGADGKHSPRNCLPRGIKACLKAIRGAAFSNWHWGERQRFLRQGRLRVTCCQEEWNHCGNQQRGAALAISAAPSGTQCAFMVSWRATQGTKEGDKRGCFRCTFAAQSASRCNLDVSSVEDKQLHLRLKEERGVLFTLRVESRDLTPRSPEAAVLVEVVRSFCARWRAQL